MESAPPRTDYSEENQSDMTQDIKLKAEEVIAIIKSGDDSLLQKNLSCYPHDKRSEIVNCVSGLKSPLVTACLLHHYKMVDFLLESCGADVNRKDNSSLLWDAVDVNDKYLVRLLLAKGADINSISDSGIPVLHRAFRHGSVKYITEGDSLDGAFSFDQDYTLARYLIENGADVNITDIDENTCLYYLTTDTLANREMVKFIVDHGFDLNGRCSGQMTYLMLSVEKQNEWLCRFLIPKLDTLNGKDKRGRTALHYTCTRKHVHFKLMKMLVNAGIDVNIVDNEGLSAIQLAATEKWPVSVSYLAELESVSLLAKVSAYYVLGALMNTGNIAYEFWSKALGFRKNLPLKDGQCHTSTDPIIQEAEDIVSREQLIEVINDVETTLIQSVFILDKYLGRNNVFTVDMLKQLAIHYWNGGEISKIADTVSYSLGRILNGSRCMLVSLGSVQSTGHIINLLFRCINSEDVNFYSRLRVIISGFTHQMEMLHKTGSTPVSNALNVFVDCLTLFFNLRKNASEMTEFINEIKYLVHLDAKIIEIFGQGILHKVLTRRNELPDQRPEIADCLIQCGLSVNVIDCDNNTPLHLVCLDMRHIADNMEVIQFLMEHEPHLDIRNKQCETVLMLMERLHLPVCKVKYTTLQCLAATVIKRNNVSFRSKVPKFLESFIDLH